MLSHSCAACGKSITEAALQQGTAVQHGNRVYCASCAALIVTPGSLPAVTDAKPELEVLAEFKVSIHAPDVISPFAAPAEEKEPKLPVTADVDLIEGADCNMATSHDDDDWFKPRGSSVATADGSAPRIQPAAPAAPKPAPVPARPAAKSSGVSSRVGAPTAAPVAKKKVAPSARMAAVAPEAEVEAEPEAAPVVQPKKSGRISAVKQPVAPASRGGSSRRISAVQAKAAPAPAPAAEEDVSEVADEPGQDVVVASPSRGKSSRRMPAAKGSARSSAARGRSDERDEKDSRKDKKKGGKKDDKMPMYIGAGVVAVLLIGAFILMGRDKEEDVSAKKAVEEIVDKTPSGKYARMAEEALSSGSKSKAVDFYTKAAGQAEREGSTSQARTYSMKAMNLIKSSKLSDR